MTWMQFDWLLSRLPLESAFRTEVRDLYTDEQLAEMYGDNDNPKHGPWSRQELLTARLIDTVSSLIHVELRVAGNNPDAPTPVRVPGSTASSRKARDPQAVAYMQNLREQYLRGAD